MNCESRSPSRKPLARRFLLMLVLGIFCTAAVPTRADDTVDFNRDIKPVFASRCYECHGPDKQESGLRLDNGASTATGGNSGAALVAGKSVEGLLIQAVPGAEGFFKMPPKGPALEPAQIEVLKRWIARGAKLPADATVALQRRKSDHW